MAVTFKKKVAPKPPGPHFHLVRGDMLEELRKLPENSIDSVVCDPPYHLNSIVRRFGASNAAPAKSNGPTGVYARASKGFMGKTWDGGDLAFRPETWAEVLRVLKPGSHMLAFGGTKGFHRMACAIEDAGFEIRDTVMWLYGTGFPKSRNIGKDVDKVLGAKRKIVGVQKAPGMAARNVEHGAQGRSTFEFVKLSDEPATEEAKQWEGWGTALKPAYEPILLVRKPLIGTIVENVLEHGTGALNINGCKIEGAKPDTTRGAGGQNGIYGAINAQGRVVDDGRGRWPANVIHDGSDEVMAAFPAESSGSSARFFYCAKASNKDRGEDNNHPTVKPTKLCQYLCRLITPPGGTVLDPFMGSGSTGKAAMLEGFNFIGIELEEESYEIAERRIKKARANDD